MKSWSDYSNYHCDDVEVDVCVCCGSYYSVTQTIIELWKKSFNYRKDAVMPQFCHRCMRDHA